MKIIISILFALLLIGCAPAQVVHFSPSLDYAVSIRSELFDTVRIDNNDITLFSKGKALGFMRVEPVPNDVTSTLDFLETLRSASESEVVSTQTLNISPEFAGFSAKVRDYLTGYLVNEKKPEFILIISFPEDKFEEITRTISSGL